MNKGLLVYSFAQPILYFYAARVLHLMTLPPPLMTKKLKRTERNEMRRKKVRGKRKRSGVQKEGKMK